MLLAIKVFFFPHERATFVDTLQKYLQKPESFRNCHFVYKNIIEGVSKRTGLQTWHHGLGELLDAEGYRASPLGMRTDAGYGRHHPEFYGT